ncbi:hypothetical protein [Paenibacillus lutrae]|nr:hypothetical protein [Paenibacillus lutrae]
MFETIDFSPGRIEYNEYKIDGKAILDENNDDLQEDMFFVRYPGNYA